uniref:USP domain-containing protein n=1 Tax=Corethron hystrix TaxID=216773 RepID=A0A7S1BPE2_9STRA
MLRSYILSGQYLSNLNSENPLGTGGKILLEFAELTKQMWAGKYANKAPQRFRGALSKARNKYATTEQQDAQEFLADMLDALHEDSNKVKKKPMVPPLDDDWVEKTALHRVGLEAWRRYLRRDRSVIASTIMGQTLNRVTCPVCHHTSTSFDPFSMLSVPVPAFEKMMVRCKILRRATSLNCPRALCIQSLVRPKQDLDTFSKSDLESDIDMDLDADPDAAPPSAILEQYIVEVSRLSEIGVLKASLAEMCGISAGALLLCEAETTPTPSEGAAFIRQNPFVTYIPVNEARPCAELSQLGNEGAEGSQGDDPDGMVIELMAFELTLKEWPSVQVFAQDLINGSFSTKSLNGMDLEDARFLLEKQLYGHRKECRRFDLRPERIINMMSKCLWPRTTADFRRGLRIEYLGDRNQKLPGTVIDVLVNEDNPDKTKVLVHFDHLASKWAEKFTLDDFLQKKIAPLYTKVTPRAIPIEGTLYHRHSGHYFGNTSFLHFHNEWSMARAGAHIMAQAARFLHEDQSTSGGHWIATCQRALGKAIDIILDIDKAYVDRVLRDCDDKFVYKKPNDQIKKSTYDASSLNDLLEKKMTEIFTFLPFCN